MTYDQEFIAVRHESDILTPLFHAPFVSLSVRELGYVGAFVICAMLSLAGSAPPWLGAAGLVLAAAAFFRWRGETPEMYLYYAALAALESPLRKGGRGGGAGRRRRKRRGGRGGGPLAALSGRRGGGGGGGGVRAAAHQVAGPGTEHVLGSGYPAAGAAGRGGPACERILIGAGGAPVDLTLDLGAARAHAGVVVLVDGAELVRDTANGEGLLTVTLIPRAGMRRIEVRGAAAGEGGEREGGPIASRTVEFVKGEGGGGGGGGGADGGRP